MMTTTRFSRFCAFMAAPLMAAALSACSPQTAEAPRSAVPATAATHAVSGLDVIPVTITTRRGQRHFRAEVARTAQQQSRGLMFRTEMGADEGMLFPYDTNPHILGFWMRNTVLPLDIVFISPERRVLNIAANAVPYSEASLYSEGVAAAVLELNGGRAAALGIAPGDAVAW